MAEQLLIRNSVRVKRRNPWGVFGLSALTLGIYAAVWFYKVNRELRDYGRTFAAPPLGENPLKVTPAVSVLAISPLTLVLLYIPGFVSMHRTGRRVQRAQTLSGAGVTIDLGVGATLFGVCMVLGGVFLGMWLPFWAVFVQSQLNRVWAAPGAGAAEPVQAAAELTVVHAAEWLPDPTGRHQLRYWDGSIWSEHVSDAGQQGVDPLAPAAPVSAVEPEPTVTPEPVREPALPR